MACPLKKIMAGRAAATMAAVRMAEKVRNGHGLRVIIPAGGDPTSLGVDGPEIHAPGGTLFEKFREHSFQFVVTKDQLAPRQSQPAVALTNQAAWRRGSS